MKSYKRGTQSKKMTSFSYDFYKHHKLVLKKDRYEEKGLTGLINLGNTCFMNSTIQCLSHTLKLTDFFLSCQFKNEDKEHSNRRREEWKFVMCFLNLMINIWENNTLIKPKSFQSALSSFVPQYKLGRQQDSHECLMHILDLLHKGLSYEIVVDVLGQVQSNADKLMKKSIESWTQCFSKNYSSIIDMFYGQFFDVIQCNKCGTVDTLFTPYNTLALDICENGGECSLDTCLEAYFAPINIQTWKCEKANCTVGCTKHTTLWTMPNYLVVQLKRFNNNNNKITSLVKFPLDDLDLTKYISVEKEDPNNYIYTCYAVNYHSGSTNSGHYWAACRGINNKWSMFNDADVSRCKTSDIVTKDAYVLFYYRKFIQPDN